MKSILQTGKQCWVCGSPYTVCHHVFEGTHHRSLSEKYGLKVYLCGKHHNASNEGVHFNPTLDAILKQYAQKKFEETHTREEFIKIFKRNYL
jgi:hypothetical protein